MVWFDMSILFKLSLWPGYQNTGWPGLAAPCQAQDWFGVCDAAWPLPGSAGRCCGSARRPLYRLLEGGHHHHHHASCYSTTYTTYVYLHLNLTTSVCSSIFYIYFMKLAETELQLQVFLIRHHSPSRDLRKYFYTIHLLTKQGAHCPRCPHFWVLIWFYCSNAQGRATLLVLGIVDYEDD